MFRRASRFNVLLTQDVQSGVKKNERQIKFICSGLARWRGYVGHVQSGYL